MRITNLVISGIVVLLHGMNGCYPIAQRTWTSSQVQQQGTMGQDTVQGDTTGAVRVSPTLQSDTVMGERHKLLPLRAYVDELARRQAHLERRIDSLSQVLDFIKQGIQKTQSIPNVATPREDTLYAGEMPSADGNQKSTLPPLARRSGIILPDNQEIQRSASMPASKPSSRKLRNLTMSRRRSLKVDTSITVQQTIKSPRTRHAPATTQTQLNQAFDSAMIAFRAGQYQETITKLSQLLEQESPRKGEYYYWRAVAHYMQQNMQAAYTDCEQAWKALRQSSSPRAPDALYLLAELTADRGDLQHAKMLLRTLLERYSGTDAALLARKKLQQLFVSK